LWGFVNNFYTGRQFIVDFTGVTDLHAGSCRQFDKGECRRGGFCSFIHLQKPSKELTNKLFYDTRQEKEATKEATKKRKNMNN
jgi:hypothetical protein